jgi:ubiquinone/menaquinone biosynthesis C-methylase UbiE
MLDLWNTRYRSDEYIYGLNPNDFLRNQLLNLKPGRILFPAEGEGRNAVYAASLCWKVDAFDFSEEARKKALKLADKNKVTVQYKLASLDEVVYENDSFDCVALIYVHQPAIKRTEYHHKLLSYLKPGGTIILEAFAKNQLRNNSGGPKDIDLLYSITELQDDFQSLSFYDIKEESIVLDEGLLHCGNADVIRLIGTK